MSMVEMHEKHWTEFMEDQHQRSLYDSWWTQGTVNYWRHTRLLAPVLDVLPGLRNHSWLTIGDGAGTDAWRLHQAGFDQVWATDLDDTVLRQTKESGLIANYSIENAEDLSYADNSFDFVLCKEALHHMSRPYAAIYEFFRVARYGVVVIEPQDAWIDWPCRTDATLPHYEAVGNYVYEFSVRELEKIAYGLNIIGVATRHMVDVYVSGCEFAYCVEGDPIWEETREKVEQTTRGMQEGTIKPNYVQGIFFKNSVAPEVFDMLAKQNPEWRFLRTDTNPSLSGNSAA
ncbi:MAG: class I SAM-dependent methyltransferase [Betaproteobacteria bacterium]|nr:class I SAM-dependent methyltransferase [Betaproteobacteria bacterium]